MAIIYSYPTVIPTANDLVLGTDVDQVDKPTKNFTVQSIIDLVTVSGNDLQAVLNNGNTATQNIILTGNISATQYTDGTMNITGGVGSGFTSVTSTDFAGNLTGIVKAGSSIESTVTGVTQNQGDNSTKLATTAYVDGKVDTSVLQYLGDSTGPFDLNLVSDDFKITGTTNQIETTATAVAGNVGVINLKFPTAGVVLPDGSTATTQASSDNSTKVATTAFARSIDDSQDLDFLTGSGGGSVLLNSQALTLAGTTNQIATSGSGQTVTFALTSDVTISGTYTGTTFAGDLLGTVNTATTGTTQNAGDNSTKIATTAYVDNAAGAKTLDYAGDSTGPFTLNLSTDDLEFNGDSNISVSAAAVAANKGIVTIDLDNDVTISGTMQAGTLSDGTFSGSSGTYTGGVSITSTDFVGALTGNASTATALASGGTIQLLEGAGATQGVGSNAVTYTSGGNVQLTTSLASTVVTGKVLTNLPSPTSSAITASDTILAAMAKLQGQITGIPQGLVYKGTWNANTNTPTLASGTGTTGEFYIVSVAGSTNLDGITDWQVGDWAIFVEVGATDTWQKIDNSQSITGSGATNKIARWTAPTVLGTGLIEDDGTTVTIGTNGNLTVQGDTILGDNAAADTVTLNGPTTFESTGIFKAGIGLGAGVDYGDGTKVLTSSGASGTAPTWETPTTGTVTSVATNNGLTGGTITTSGTIGILTTGATNAIEFLSSATPASGDFVWFSDINDNNTIRKCTISSLPFDQYTSWTLAADSGSSQTISSGNTATIAGGTGINTAASATDTVTVNIDYAGNDNAIEAAADGTSITVAATDKLWVSDATDNTIKQINASQITTISDQALSSVLAIGNTSGANDILMADNQKVSFGGAPDFSIYHNATSNANIITSLLDRQLQITTNNLYVGNQAATETMITAVANGAVTLYYDNSAKLATTTSGVTITGDLTVDAGTSSTINIYKDDAGNGKLSFYNDSTQQVYLLHDTAENFYIHGGSGTQILMSSDNATTLTLKTGQSAQLNAYGSGTKTGTPAYNLQVDSSGNIIETGNVNPHGSGIYSFSDTVNASSNENIFSIACSHGAQAFTAYFTCNTTGVSVAKVYTVVHSYGTTVTYNKLADTGPYGGTSTDDFTVTFTGSNDTITCNIANPSSTNLDIVTTIMLGGSPTALTVTAL